MQACRSSLSLVGRRWKSGLTTNRKKVVASAEEATNDILPGASLLVGGFGLTGVPENLIRGVVATGADDLKVVSSNVGTAERGLGLLFQTKQISKMTGSYVGENEIFEQQFLNGEIEVELMPMGTLAEKMRAAGAGVPAFFTRTGVGTLVQHGGMPMRYSTDGSRNVIKTSTPRMAGLFKPPLAPPDAKPTEYILEQAMSGDFALVKAWKADPEGNLVYRMTSRNHNPAVATAGRITIAEVEEIVPLGSLDPNEIHTPGIYVDRVVQGDRIGVIERLTLASKKFTVDGSRETIARRAALELVDGDYVNLGIGIPTLVSNYVPEKVEITLQSENGMLGVGPFPSSGSEDCDLINAGKQTVTALDGASYFSADQSFAMIRGAHCQLTILGSMQVSMHGDMSNYLIPGKLVKGMGGAMDLVASGSRVVVTMEHCDKHGNSKILPSCTLPLTGKGVVDTIITEKAVFKVLPDLNGLQLIEVGKGETVDTIREVTEAPFTVSDDVKPMRESRLPRHSMMSPEY
ncbi:hypothetical protein TrVE_jg12914 [Triparma verrucosa]|uniref:Succinyl-CoA:3-ketoacid-coenzyme A transferase n=1 Tax=Triparma verrucosa TaxID=1606542 RepID=A0A9W7F095_9STRA|nr:hypothetical protein TrVE_jg12914 [Triparma verrucosa]